MSDGKEEKEDERGESMLMHITRTPTFHSFKPFGTTPNVTLHQEEALKLYGPEPAQNPVFINSKSSEELRG